MRTPRRSGRLAAAVLALSAAAPAAPAAPPASLRARPGAVLPAVRCSIPNAEAWREYRSAHVVLSTDASRERAAALVAELERLHAYVVAALFGPDVDVPGRVRAVAFANIGQYQRIAPDQASGFTRNDGWQLTVVFPFEGLAPVAETIAHELAHDAAWHHFPRQPRWFAEGLAMFVESVAEERQDERTGTLGSHLVLGDRQQGGRWAGFVSPHLAELVRGSLTVGARELLEWGGTIDGDPARFHVGSWVLYHYLWNQRSAAFTAYQERLASGDEPNVAWRTAFPDLDPASAGAMSRLDDELAQYRKRGRYASYRVEPGIVDVSFQDRPIASADVHVLLAGIRPEADEGDAARKAAASADLDEALREDPLQPAALARRARAGGTSVAAALRPATGARPEDARAWLELADALQAPADAKEKEAALRKAAALAPEDARANAELASVLAASGRAREARPFADRAVDLAPWNGGAVQTLAAVALGLGQCRPAIVLQRRAVNLYAAGDAGGDGARGRLAEYEAKCGAAAAGASGAPKEPR